MKEIELTIASEYVDNWGIWEAVRELIQNAQDSSDKGHKVSYDFLKRSNANNVLIIKNKACSIDRETLLLGVTSKKEDSTQRGQFGEGYKLALLVLCRLGYKIWIDNGTERWIPKLKRSKVFNRDTLHIQIKPIKYVEDLTIKLFGLSEIDWDNIRNKCLFFYEDYDKNTEFYLSEKIAGKIFCKDLFIYENDKIKYGYNLKDLNLNRDRSHPDIHSLRYNIIKTLDIALYSKKISVLDILKLIGSEYEEANAIQTNYSTYAFSIVRKKISEDFFETYGENALPVDNTDLFNAANCTKYKPIIVNNIVKLIIEQEKDFSVCKLIEDEVNTNYEEIDSSELLEEEVCNFNWALSLLEKNLERYIGKISLFEKEKSINELYDINVVKFHIDKLYGRYSKTSEANKPLVLINRFVLKNKYDTLHTLIHEFAHINGNDGTNEHNETMGYIFQNLIQGLDERT